MRIEKKYNSAQEIVDDLFDFASSLTNENEKLALMKKAGLIAGFFMDIRQETQELLEAANNVRT